MKPSIGRIVHVRINDTEHGSERWRPAIVTCAFSAGLVNAEVILDGCNDSDFDPISIGGQKPVANRVHVYSRVQGEDVGSWRWPPRV